MNSFEPEGVQAAFAAPDPYKHVKYNLGMVLGVDEFVQDFTYLAERDRWLARDAVGYGTVSGLRVEIRPEADGPQVVVSPGAALSPKGQLIRVKAAQCLDLNKWLAVEQNREKVFSRLGSPPIGSIMMYILLKYRECPTDNVPIPGEPCRSAGETLAASRWVDDFLLLPSLDPPIQCEESALRQYIHWLRQIEVITETGSPVMATSLEDFIETIRNAAQIGASPPGTLMDFMMTSPPESIAIPDDALCEYLRAAFRIWITELREHFQPPWHASSQPCDADSPSDDNESTQSWVLLAKLQIPIETELTGELKVSDEDPVLVNEDERPFVVHLRMLQEYLLCGRAAGGDGGVWTHSALAGLDGDDHDHYLLVDRSTRALVTDLDGGAHKIVNLNPAEANGEAVVFQQAVKSGDPAGGDLTEAYPSPVVARLQGRAVRDRDPQTGQVLTWSGSAWAPRPVQAVSLVTIQRISTRIFSLWFHLDTAGNRMAVEEGPLASGIRVLAETDDAPFLEAIRIDNIIRLNRNHFRVTLNRTAPLMRFQFNMPRIRVSDGTRPMTLLSFAQRTGINFVGQDGRNTITIFFNIASEA
jgi:hypothetical protein